MNTSFPNSKTLREKLFKRVIKSSFWVFLLRILDKILNLIKLFILARILLPSDFGLMGIALLTISILDTFSQTGFHHALIQKEGDIRLYLDSAWTISIIRGIVLFVFIFLIAPYAASFFYFPEAKFIIQVVGFSLLFQSFSNIGTIYFHKDLKFNKQFIYQLTGTLADFIISIWSSIILKSVWALVFGMLAGSIAKCITSYFIHPYRPSLNLNFQKTKELFRFGKWVLGSSILIFLLTQGDDIIVGKMLGVTALGFYQMAYRISNLPATEISHVISQVTFPAYSKLQKDTLKLREAYLKVLKVTGFLAFPIGGLIFVWAPNFTKIFLGEKWMPMVPAMRVLVLYGVIRSIGATTGPLFYSLNKPSFVTKIQIIKLIILILTLYPFTKFWGFLGTSWAILLNAILVNPISNWLVIKLIRFNVVQFIKTLLLPVLLSILCVSLHFLYRNLFHYDYEFVSLVILLILDLMSYFILIVFVLFYYIRRMNEIL